MFEQITVRPFVKKTSSLDRRMDRCLLLSLWLPISHEKFQSMVITLKKFLKWFNLHHFNFWAVKSNKSGWPHLRAEAAFTFSARLRQSHLILEEQNYCWFLSGNSIIGIANINDYAISVCMKFAFCGHCSPKERNQKPAKAFPYLWYLKKWWRLWVNVVFGQ